MPSSTDTFEHEIDQLKEQLKQNIAKFDHIFEQDPKKEHEHNQTVQQPAAEEVALKCKEIGKKLIDIGKWYKAVAKYGTRAQELLDDEDRAFVAMWYRTANRLGLTKGASMTSAERRKSWIAETMDR